MLTHREKEFLSKLLIEYLDKQYPLTLDSLTEILRVHALFLKLKLNKEYFREFYRKNKILKIYLKNIHVEDLTDRDHSTGDDVVNKEV
jgi:hypothetical protein